MGEEVTVNDEDKDWMVCPECFGDGWVVDEDDWGGGYICPPCGGRGWVVCVDSDEGSANV